MQTLTLQIKDDFMSEVFKFIESAKENIVIKKDKNLEIDPYFYERQLELQRIRNDIKSGKSKTSTLREFEAEMEAFEKNLEGQYAS